MCIEDMCPILQSMHTGMRFQLDLQLIRLCRYKLLSLSKQTFPEKRVSKAINFINRLLKVILFGNPPTREAKTLLAASH